MKVTITQQEKINKFLLSGLQNLRSGLDGLNLENFVVNTLEVLMHLERDEYLEEIKNHHLIDKGNDTYPRSFKSFSKNSLFINIPRTRYTDFKPVVLEFLKYNQEQVNELVLKLYTKGMTTRDVSEVLGDFFGEDISYAQVSDLAEKFNEILTNDDFLEFKKEAESYFSLINCNPFANVSFCWQSEIVSINAEDDLQRRMEIEAFPSQNALRAKI